MNRINRVTSILIQLQSKKIIPAKEIAQRFNISLRTVYRDIRTLEEAGIPIGSEAGKGYFLVEGFLLPPVMFTAAEVGALITAGKFLNCHGDESFIKDFDSAMYKIKSILKHGEKNYGGVLETIITTIDIHTKERKSNGCGYKTEHVGLGLRGVSKEQLEKGDRVIVKNANMYGM